jgi:biotin carboxylase
MADGNGIVLVVGSGGQHYREYLLAGASKRYRLWLLDATEPTWQRPYVVGGSIVELLDPARLIPNQSRLIDTAVRLATRHQVAGVFTYDETLVIATAHIAETLGLPGMTVAAADRCRNKHRTRQTLTEAGLPQPRFVLVDTVEEARAAAAVIGYPLVLKPRGMGASIGVVRVDTATELDTAFAVAERASHGGSPAYEGGVLVEELLTGPEISIDGAVFEGEYHPFFLARKQVGLAPSFEEVGHVLSADDPLLDDPELGKVLIEAHDALGIRYGITHTEVLLTKRGPAIVEVNGRLGGDLIPYLGKLATGIDPARIAVDIATHTRPVIRHAETGCAGIRFLYPPRDCRVRTVTLPAPGAAAGLLEARAMAQPGTLLRLPPRAHLGRYAYLICKANDPDTCNARLDAAASLTTLSYDDAEGVLAAS